MKKEYCINVPPISWQRAGVNGRRFFDRQSQDKIAYGLILQQQHGDLPLFEKALMIEIRFLIKPPKLIKQRSPYCKAKPDLDNLEKFLLDVGTGILYTDDRIVCAVTKVKMYDLNPRTEIIITELE